jgi:hypothetical protein
MTTAAELEGMAKVLTGKMRELQRREAAVEAREQAIAVREAEIARTIELLDVAVARAELWHLRVMNGVWLH